MKRRIGLRKLALVGVAVATAAAVTIPVTVSFASVPNSATGQVNACYATSGGALRVIDAQAGATCRGNEQPLSWPAAGGASTMYAITTPRRLHPLAGLNVGVLPGKTLSPGTWSLSWQVMVANATGTSDTLRCGLYNRAGGLVSGSATTMGAFTFNNVSASTLVTITAADGFELDCFHDTNLFGGDVTAFIGQVVAVQTASRF